MTPGRLSVFLEILRRPPVAVGLLVAFTFLVGVVNQRDRYSVDEGFQIQAALHPIPYIVTHDPQNHPFYGVFAHLAIRYMPRAPIHPVRVPSFVVGMFVPLVFYLTHRRWVGHEAAIVSATILVVVDSIRFYMSIGRGYSLQVLGVLVLNALLITTLRRGGWARMAAYGLVGAATCLTHLWTFPVLGAHGLFLVMEVFRSRGKGIAARRALAMMAVVACTIALAIAIHLPMLDEIQTVAGRKGSTPLVWTVVDGVLQLPRFAGWTVAAHLVLVPIILEGYARRPLRMRSNRYGRLYLTTILVMLAWSLAVRSSYFGSRYLMGIVPAGAGLVAWGFSGYWRGRTVGRNLPVLPRPATWTIGLAFGLLSGGASPPHEIWGVVLRNVTRGDSAYCFRDLSLWVGEPAALALLGVGVAGLGIGGRFGRQGRATEKQESVTSAVVWTGFLLASVVSIGLGSSFSAPLFEVHMVAVAAVLLDAWEHRFSNRHLRALIPAFLVIAAIVVTWQAGIEHPIFTSWVALGAAMFLPMMMIVLPLARTTGPAFSDGQGP